MKLSDSVKRVRFTISKGNKPNEKDIEAFNVICAHLQKTEEETVQENLLFAKLYAYLLGKFSMHYNDVNEANKHLNKILQQPFTFVTGILEMELKAMEVRSVIKDDILTNLSPKDVREKMKQYPKLEAEFISTWEFWDQENVTAHLNANINLSIQNFKNHV